MFLKKGIRVGIHDRTQFYQFLIHNRKHFKAILHVILSDLTEYLKFTRTQVFNVSLITAKLSSLPKLRSFCTGVFIKINYLRRSPPKKYFNHNFSGPKSIIVWNFVVVGACGGTQICDKRIKIWLFCHFSQNDVNICTDCDVINPQFSSDLFSLVIFYLITWNSWTFCFKLLKVEFSLFWGHFGALPPKPL